MRVRPERLVLAVAAAIAVAACAAYAVNPFGAHDLSVSERLFGFRFFHQMSASMEPTLRAGSYFVVRSYTALQVQPAVGDVVAFHYPPDPEVSYVKRILARGGDTVGVARGHVQRNGQSVDEPYLPPGAADDREVMEPVRLPPDCYFLLGDNRSNSMDSREYGCVPGSFLIGKVMLQPAAAKNHR